MQLENQGIAHHYIGSEPLLCKLVPKVAKKILIYENLQLKTMKIIPNDF